MGWNGGNDIARALIPVITKQVKDSDARREIYARLIKSLRDKDWDTEDEMEGYDADFDRALESLR
jgi:hypothetical protein